MDNEVMTSGQAYTFVLLHKWEELIGISEEFRSNYLRCQIDKDSLNVFISKLTRMWLELYPKVKSRHEFGDLSDRFEDYEEYYINPEKLTIPENAGKLFELESIVREALERLGITDFERDKL